MSKVKEGANATDNGDATVTREPVKHPTEVPGMIAVDTEVDINKTTLSGKVSGYHLSTDNKTLSYLVKYEEDGEEHERGFLPNQITQKKVENEKK